MKRLCLLLALAGAAQVLWAGLYPAQGGGSQRWNHAYSGSAIKPPLEAKWIAPDCLVGPPRNAPIIVEDRVVRVGQGGLACYKRSDGAMLWRWRSLGVGDMMRGPVYDSARGLVYAQPHCGYLVALNIDNGAVIWSRYDGPTVPKKVVSVCPVLDGDLLYYCSQARYIVCLNVDTLKEVWRWDAGAGYNFVTPSLAAGGLLVPTNDGPLFKLDPATGKMLWRVDCAAGSGDAVLVEGSRLYRQDVTGRVECREIADGTLVWTYRTGSFGFSSPAISCNILVVANDDRCVHALDVATGNLLWKRCFTGNFAWSAPFIDCDVVYVSGCTGNFYAMELSTGAFLWSYTHNYDNSFTDWSEDGGDLFTCDRVGNLYKFGMPQGATVTACACVIPTATAYPTMFYRSPTVTPSITVTVTPTITPSSTATPTATQTATLTRTATDTTTVSPTHTATATASPTPTASPTFSASPTASETGTITPTDTASPTFSASPTASQTDTATPSPSSTETSTATVTGTSTARVVDSPTSSATATPSGSATGTPTATASATRTATPTASVTSTASATTTATPSSTPTATASVTDATTATPTSSATPRPCQCNGRALVANTGSVMVDSKGSVLGDIQAGGTLTLQPGSTFTGGLLENTPGGFIVTPLPSATNLGTVLVGSGQTLTLAAGDYTADSVTVQLGGTLRASGPVRLYSRGAIILGGATAPVSGVSSDLIILSDTAADFHVNSQAVVVAVAHVPNARALVDSSFTGCLVAKEAIVNSNGVVRQDAAIACGATLPGITATLAPEAVAYVEKVVVAPNPVVGASAKICVKLGAPAERLTVTVYTKSMIKAGQFCSSSGRGAWMDVTLPDMGLANGVYYVQVTAMLRGTHSEKWATMVVLK